MIIIKQMGFLTIVLWTLRNEKLCLPKHIKGIYYICIINRYMKCQIGKLRLVGNKCQVHI